MAEDPRRDIVCKTRNGLAAACKRGNVGGRPTVIDDDKRAAILARRDRDESIRTIAAGVLGLGRYDSSGSSRHCH